MAVLPVERLQRLIGQAGKGGMGHIDEMAVLILAVLAGQAAAAQLGVEIPEALVFAVGIVAIPEIELQRVVVILAEIHQCVHFLIGHRVLGDDRTVPVHHAGSVVGDGVVEPDAAQLLLVDRAVAAAGAQHKFAACGLHLFHGLDHRRAGAGLTKGNKGIVEIACQKLILHNFLPKPSPPSQLLRQESAELFQEPQLAPPSGELAKPKALTERVILYR